MSIRQRYRNDSIPMRAIYFICLSLLTTTSLIAEISTNLKIKEGFQIDLLHEVDAKENGSWVAMCADDRGRLIVSDQYGKLFRLTLPALDAPEQKIVIETIPADIGAAQGLAFVKGALYLQVNGEGYQGRGLYRVTDSNQDDQLDQVELLRGYEGRSGEHGPHAVVPAPDGESIYVVVGNQTPLPKMDHYRVPPLWGEDLLTPRIYGRGFMRDAMAPRGWVAKVSLDGKHWELITTGFRNQYDAAFNREGDLFTYDADMEWDLNTPWYRPTRVCQVLSGADFGWRNGSGKWPNRWEDSAPPVVDIGPGSPTGVVFGYNAKFPARYQEALFIADWSYGKLYAVHLQPEGAGYQADVEEFLSGQPLPLTDMIVHPQDGAMYIIIGGRRTQSGLYRVTYTGAESTETKPVEWSQETRDLHALRRQLEAFHGVPDAEGVELALRHIGHADRLIRAAARTVLESNPIASWKDKVLEETDTRAALTGLMALARIGQEVLQEPVLQALDRIDPQTLNNADLTTLVRNYVLAWVRLGTPTDEHRAQVVQKFSSLFPHKDIGLSQDLAELLVVSGDPAATPKAVDLVHTAPTQEEQIAYAKHVRLAKVGWTQELRQRMFEWFPRAYSYTGGNGFSIFIDEIKKDLVDGLTADERLALKDFIDLPAQSNAPVFSPKPLAFQKMWTMADLTPSLGVGLEGGRNFENGRNSFGAVGCFACHRMNMEGGALGPDLTSVAGKFSPHDLLESIIDPSKEISDQYGTLEFKLKDGGLVLGRIVNLSGDKITVNTNMLDPNALTDVPRANLASIDESKVSMMPPGLLNTLTEDDILDLLAYLLSQGNPEHELFSKD